MFKLLRKGHDVAVAIMLYHAEARSGISETLSENHFLLGRSFFFMEVYNFGICSHCS